MDGNLKSRKAVHERSLGAGSSLEVYSLNSHDMPAVLPLA
jgi:hypothetical protein